MKKNIKNIQGYSVDSDGIVYNGDKVLSAHIDKDGYVSVKIGRKNYKVHRLVAEAFIPNPSCLPVVDHVNEIKNDNRVSNLRWCTVDQNNEWYATSYKRDEQSRNNKNQRARIAEKLRDKREADKKELAKKKDNLKLIEKEVDKKLRELAQLKKSVLAEQDQLNILSIKISGIYRDMENDISKKIETTKKDVEYEKIRLHNLSLTDIHIREIRAINSEIAKRFEKIGSKFIIVDGKEFASVGSAASYVVEHTGTSTLHSTIRKELSRYLSGSNRLYAIHGLTVGY